MDSDSDSLVEVASPRKPEWLLRPSGADLNTRSVKELLRKSKLNTVCEEARCPNIAECFGRGTATFMILGDVCTRGCRFCSVKTGRPTFAKPEALANQSGRAKLAARLEESGVIDSISTNSDVLSEAKELAQAAEDLNLKHVVVTSVARDDLVDGGAGAFVAVCDELKSRIPEVTIEILVPDFRGDEGAIDIALSAGAEVFNHNLETVPRLYRKVRPGASYRRSLDLLSRARDYREASGFSYPRVKTGIMLGLGETKEEVESLMRDSFEAGVDVFTAGQYMQPNRKSLPVTEWVSLEDFASYEKLAEDIGFSMVTVGPLVRSSYMADKHATEIL